MSDTRCEYCDDQLAELRAKIVDLESELEGHAWEVSPAMAQAAIDQHCAKIERLEADRAKHAAIVQAAKEWHLAVFDRFDADRKLRAAVEANRD